MKGLTRVKKFTLGLALSGALIAGASYGTYSWYTSEVKATGEVTTKTFELTRTPYTASRKIIDVKNMAPGRSFEYPSENTEDEGWIGIQNSGQEPMFLRGKLDISLKDKNGNQIDDTSEYNRKLGKYTFNISVHYQPKGGKRVLVKDYALRDLSINDSRLANFLNNWQPSENGSTTPIQPGDKVFLKVHRVMLDPSANNDWQGDLMELNYKVEAKQVEDGAQFN